MTQELNNRTITLFWTFFTLLVMVALLIFMFTALLSEKDYTENTPARIRAACGSVKVKDVKPIGDYELLVFCADGRWADLKEGQDEPFLVKAR